MFPAHQQEAGPPHRTSLLLVGRHSFMNRQQQWRGGNDAYCCREPWGGRGPAVSGSHYRRAAAGGGGRPAAGTAVTVVVAVTSHHHHFRRRPPRMLRIVDIYDNKPAAVSQ